MKINLAAVFYVMSLLTLKDAVYYVLSCVKNSPLWYVASDSFCHSLIMPDVNVSCKYVNIKLLIGVH